MLLLHLLPPIHTLELTSLPLLLLILPRLLVLLVLVFLVLLVSSEPEPDFRMGGRLFRAPAMVPLL